MQKILKIGIIGTGQISNMHLMASQRASEKVKLTAACDIREDAVREFAKRAAIDAIYTDVTSMLDKADIEAVIISARNQEHRNLAIAAAKAGKHVFLEKPMGNSMQECRDIIAATEKAGVTLMIGQQLRYVPNYISVRRLIQEGELGQIWGVRADVWCPFILVRPEKVEQFFINWRTDKQAGGGALMMNGTHFIDLLRYFVGDAKRVLAKTWTDHPLFTGGAEDSVMATIEFENGAVGHLSNSWTTRAPWLFQFMILGSEGTIYNPAIEKSPIEQHESPAVVSSPRHDIAGAGPGGEPLRPFVPIEPPKDVFHENPYVNELAHFADCCRSGKESISSGRDNIGTMKIIFGIHESARTGNPVELSTL